MAPTSHGTAELNSTRKKTSNSSLRTIADASAVDGSLLCFMFRTALSEDDIAVKGPNEAKSDAAVSFADYGRRVLFLLRQLPSVSNSFGPEKFLLVFLLLHPVPNESFGLRKHRNTTFFSPEDGMETGTPA